MQGFDEMLASLYISIVPYLVIQFTNTVTDNQTSFMMSSQPMSVDAAKYNVRARLKGKIDTRDVIAVEVDASADANANESFASSDESGASERLELPLRNLRLDLGSTKSSPGTPSRGFVGRNIDTDLAR